MGAETTIFVKVARLRTEWITVSAVTRQEAMEKAKALPDVAMAVEASYDPPDDIGDRT